jgi:hypothetical protein
MRRLLVLAGFILLAASSRGAETIETYLTAGGFVEVFAKDGALNTSIPQIRVYSASGLELAEFSGYSPALREFLEAALLQEPRPGARKLVDLVPLMTKPDGTKFAAADLPKNERVIATFGAEWCGPCRVLKRDLSRMEGFTVLEVDADNRRIGDEAIRKALFGGRH